MTATVRPTESPLPVLIVGLPRSGTSWLGSVLSAIPGATYRFEPDNEDHQALARWAKQRLSRFPVLAAGDHQPRFAVLWRVAFGGRAVHDLVGRVLRRAGRLPGDRSRSEILARSAIAAPPSALLGYAPASGLTPAEQLRVSAGALLELALRVPSPVRRPAARIVKSVHAVGAVPWIVARWPCRVIVIRRHPLAILASMLQLGWGGPSPRHPVPHIGDGLVPAELLPPIADAYAALLASASDPDDARLIRLAALITVLVRLLATHATPHAAAVVDHEALCLEPKAGFDALCAAVGLPMDPALTARVAALDTPGDAPYGLRRDTASQVDKWRATLGPDRTARALDVFAQLGLDVTAWPHDA